MRNNLLKTIKIISSLIITIILMVVIFQGSFLNKKYLKPWNENYYKQFSDIRLQVISHGLLAPNAHNMQSWRIVLDKDDNKIFYLYLDENRLLPETDPNHRQSIISQGTFLELCDIASIKLGYKLDVTLYPIGELGHEPSPEEIREKPTARVKLVPADKEEPFLYLSIFERVTTRTEYLMKPLTQEQINIIFELNDDPNISVFVFQDSDELNFLKDLAIKGTAIESQTEKIMNESSIVLRYSEYQKNKYRYGLTLGSQGWSRVKEFSTEFLANIFPIGSLQEGEIWLEAETERITKTPAYIMIVSDNNDRKTQVKVGMLYSRIQLVGTNMGLSMQPTMQITQEYQEMKELYDSVTTKFTEKGQTIQMLFRVGESEKKVKHSPRMDVLQLIGN